MSTNKYTYPGNWRRAFRSEKNPLDLIDYPLGYMFPPWCHGAGVGISRSAMTTIYSVAVHTWRERFKIDDLLFFGVYPNLTDIRIVDLPRFALNHYQVSDDISEGYLREELNNRKVTLRNIEISNYINKSTLTIP